MVNLNNQYLYLKGTCNVVIRDIATGDVDYQSNKFTTAQLNTTCDLGAIQAGIGNTTVIQIPHNCALTMNLTAADFSMAARGMQVGAKVLYGGIAPECEAVLATGATLTVSKTPAKPYGYQACICNVVEAGKVNAPGTAYEIDETTKEVIGFTAVEGKSYTVTYFVENASSQYFNVGGMFAPAVKHVTVQMAVYSTAGVNSPTQGTKVGDLYYIIPRMQFNGTAETDGSQTTPASTNLNGAALTYDEGTLNGVCTDCAIPGLAQVLYVPAAGTTASLVGLAVVGGSINLVAGETIQCPVKFVMPDGTLQNPDVTALTFTIPTAGQSYATVSATGLITAVAAGDTDITIKVTDDEAIQCVAAVSVSAAG